MPSLSADVKALEDAEKTQVANSTIATEDLTASAAERRKKHLANNRLFLGTSAFLLLLYIGYQKGNKSKAQASDVASAPTLVNPDKLFSS